MLPLKRRASIFPPPETSRYPCLEFLRFLLCKGLFPCRPVKARRAPPGSRPSTDHVVGVSSVPSLQRRNKEQTFRIFPGRYPLCKGVIHVEIVENPVEKVENSPVFSVETVENPVEIPRQRVLEEKFSTIPSWRRGRLLDKGPGYVYNKNNQNCAKE